VLAILQARIGRLDASARRVLRAASVFGEIAWVGGIDALLGAGGHDIDDALQRLTEDEILEQRRDSRFPGEREVRFRHVLMRDAAYGLLTADDRADGHRAAAQYLEALGEPDSGTAGPRTAGARPPYPVAPRQVSPEIRSRDEPRGRAERRRR